MSTATSIAAHASLVAATHIVTAEEMLPTICLLWRDEHTLAAVAAVKIPPLHRFLAEAAMLAASVKADCMSWVVATWVADPVPGVRPSETPGAIEALMLGAFDPREGFTQIVRMGRNDQGVRWVGEPLTVEHPVYAAAQRIMAQTPDPEPNVRAWLDAKGYILT